MRLGIASSVLAGALLLAPAVVQGAVQHPEPGSELRVYLVTMGPGERVWERFGHNAIWIQDPASSDTAYNYGLFDFQQENFLLRFIRGQMWYWMAGFPAPQYVHQYERDNRSIWVQELEIGPQAAQELQRFLEWNAEPEHRFYHYDYYRDNCSTRVRDAIDRVIGGAIKAQTDRLPTGATYRSHTLRLTANDPPVFTGLFLALGPGVDRPISAWEEMFLPMALREHARRVVLPGPNGATVPLVTGERTIFESTAPQPPTAPPFWLPWYLALGIAVGGVAALLGRSGRRWGRAALGLVVVPWGVIGGLGGVVLAVLWGLTDHAMAYRNENLFQLNPLLLGLAVLAPLALAGKPRAARWARALALTLAALSGLGFVAQALPGLDQVNGPIIALLLPIHLGVAMGLLRAIRPASAAAPPPPPETRGTR